MGNQTAAKYLNAIHRILGASRLGARFAVKIRNQMNAVIRARMMDGIFPESNGEVLLLDAIAPSATCFVDIGANVGEWSTAFAIRAALPVRGLLFEPSPIAAQRLRAAVDSLTKTGLIHLEICEVALSDARGNQEFFMEPDAGETSSFLGQHSNEFATRVMVPVRTLDDELSERSLQEIDMVKIDAEGFDCKVLRGAAIAISRQALGVIQFEYNAPWATAGDTLYAAFAQLRSAGYSVYLLKNDGLYTFDYDCYGEFFGYANFVAVSRLREPSVLGLIRGPI